MYFLPAHRSYSLIFILHVLFVFPQDGLKLKGTHQFLVHADYINIFAGTVRTVIKKTQKLWYLLQKRLD